MRGLGAHAHRMRVSGVATASPASFSSIVGRSILHPLHRGFHRGFPRIMRRATMASARTWRLADPVKKGSDQMLFAVGARTHGGQENGGNGHGSCEYSSVPLCFCAWERMTARRGRRCGRRDGEWAERGKNRQRRDRDRGGDGNRAPEAPGRSVEDASTPCMYPPGSEALRMGFKTGYHASQTADKNGGCIGRQEVYWCWLRRASARGRVGSKDAASPHSLLRLVWQLEEAGVPAPVLLSSLCWAHWALPDSKAPAVRPMTRPWRRC